MTSYRVQYDAEQPPINPPETAAVLVYAGGALAGQPWTDAQIHAQGSRGRMPAWAYGKGRDGVTEAMRFNNWLDAHGVPADCAVMIDMETGVDADYLHAAYDILGRWTVGAYGSKDTLFSNPEPDFWYPADWTGIPHLFDHAKTGATQYAAAGLHQTAGPWDLSLVAPDIQLWSPHDDPVIDYTTPGNLSLLEIARKYAQAPSTILRVTLERQSTGRFPADLAAYINGGSLTAPMAPGIHLDIAPGRAWSG